MRWEDVKEGDTLEWLDHEADVHLVLERSIGPNPRNGMPGVAFKLLCLWDGQLIDWHSSESVYASELPIETLEESRVRLLARAGRR